MPNLDSLTEQEKEAVLKILSEMSNEGTSNTMNSILYDDYNEIPVDIGTFIHDPYYLGRGLMNAEGKFTLFPYWEELLKKIYPDPLKPAICNTLAVTGCLSGDTLIPLLSGKEVTIRDLAHTKHLDEYVYSYDVNSNSYVPGHLIEAFSTGIRDVYEITLDNGKSFKATSNHRFMLRSKQWKSIDTGLKVGDSLMTLHRRYDREITDGRSGYECILNPKKDGTYDEVYTHRLVMLWKRGRYKGVIHHKDYNHKIVSIKYVGKEEVFDLTVEKYHNFALECGIVAHNSIGTGKSTVAVVIGLYELYRMLCLKNPAVYYGIMQTDVISFAVINITIDAAQGVAWSKLQNMVQESDWFMTHGTMSRSENPEWKPNPNSKVELICGSQPRHFIGRALFWVFIDEISFIPTQDVEKQKQKATELVSSAVARMQSRFMRGTTNPTILVLASSKRTEQSFLETWIENKKRTESKTTVIVDEPQWVIRTDKNADRTFKIAIGNKFLPSEVLPPDVRDEECQSYIERGFRLLDVPIGYYENFLDDIDIALTDIAGISTSSMSNYISGERITQTKTESFVNPFTKDIIEVGNGQDDITQYSDFFDLTKVDPAMKTRPLFIHLDMSLTGDKTGVGGVWIKGLKHSTDENRGKEMYFQLAFVVSVKAPRGHQVSFEKTRNFIYWLKEQGFNIKGITSDTYARSGVEQDFLAKGYNYSILSVDRVNQERICEPYAFFKNCIYERRILLPRKGINLLTEELVGLQRNNNNGKVDHTPQGINSKDSADAVCGALYNASQHGEEYAFDYGESLGTLVEFNEAKDTANDYIKNFEETLKQQPKYIRQNDVLASFGSRDGLFNTNDLPLDIYDGILNW